MRLISQYVFAVFRHTGSPCATRRQCTSGDTTGGARLERTREQLIDHLRQYSPPLTEEQIEKIAEYMELEARVKAEAKNAVIAELARIAVE
jgi:hypothetical protein